MYVCIMRASPASPFPGSRSQECAHVQRRTSVDKNTCGIMRLGTRVDISLRYTSTEREQDTAKGEARPSLLRVKKKKKKKKIAAHSDVPRI